jgi:hypothetical protein
VVHPAGSLSTPLPCATMGGVSARLTTLYADVLRRLDLAVDLVERLDASDDVKQALHERLDRYRRAAKSDLTRTSRRLDDLLDELRAEGLLTLGSR